MPAKMHCDLLKVKGIQAYNQVARRG